MTEKKKPKRTPDLPKGAATSLVKIQLHCWPPPTSPAQAAKLHRQLVRELDKLLDPKRLPPPSVGYKPRQAVAAAESTPQGPNCWLDSSTVRACVIDGVERTCRVDLYMCDDGSWYEEEIPVEGSGGGNAAAAAGDDSDA